MVKRMTKIWACIVAILLMVSILSLNVSAISTDETEAYGYTTLSATFKSPFRTTSSGEEEMDMLVNEKYSQMRLNALYSKDISHKVSTALHAKIAAGTYKSRLSMERKS